ncbi:hypothetical protein FHG87_002958 [Trinorchestia longiramus]|nr:hypothetical protein FHG87_002958 [Trinorchestia longiramus]
MTEAADLFNSRASASTPTSIISCLADASELSSPLRPPSVSECLNFINFTNSPILSTIPDHPEPIYKITAQRLSLYFNKSSWHPCLSDSDSHFDRSSIYSSCPSINSSFSSEITPPTPPPRRAESFLCVSNYLYIRAVAAQQSYYNYLSFVSNRHRNFRMTQETGPTGNFINPSDDNQSFQTERSFDEDIPSPSNELATPSYTPPPPIGSYDSSLSPANTHEFDQNTGRTNPPMFIYSYDPPSPEIDSEYDPPFFSPPPSNISKPSFQVIDQREDVELRTTSNAQPLIRPDSDLSSSTLSATLLLTQDSDVSPLPPHADRASSLNTDTLTSSSLNTLLVTSDPSATYTCTSPAFSYNSDTLSTAPDLSKITMNDFDHQNAELENLVGNFPEEIEAKDSCTSDTICVSPLHSERASQSHSKTSEEPSLPTQSLSESRKKSTEGTTGSSDRARRSSPPSSPDLSLSSLPSDTITMNTGIDSIGTDTDSNENPAATHNTRNRVSQSVHSQDETDQTTDSAFASPSTSPICTPSLSCSVTPVPGKEKKTTSMEHRTAKDSDEGFDKNIFVAPSSDENIISDEASTTKDSREKSVESNTYVDLVDETAENESIYPESECEIRLISRADTDTADSAQRDSSPDVHTTPIIAELCHLEEEKSDKSELPEKCKESKIVRNLSSSSMKEISSSGNSSMSNSPALSAETNTPGRKVVSYESKDEINSNSDTHLNNWLHNSRPSEIHADREGNDDSVGVPDSKGNGAAEVNITIEEISSDVSSCPYSNGSRSLPSFGPLPTIHEVADTPTDNTPVSDAMPIPSLDNVENFTAPNLHNSDTSSIIYSFVHSDSPQAGSSSSSLFGNKNSAASFGNLPPPPPPRSLHAQLKTPPLPPPPSDDDGDFNPFPLPPPPSEEACLPPLPPPPVTYYNECAPPVPPHSVGPTPPQRMYLLIPLTPGLRSPLRLLSPPPAPPRSTSLRRSPPSVPSIYASRLAESDTSIPSVLNEDTNEDDRTISSPSEVGSVICVTSKLTPLPEEMSPASSPLPPALLIASHENKTPSQQDTDSSLNTKPNLTTNLSFDVDPSLSHTGTAKLLTAPSPPKRQSKSLTPTPPLLQHVTKTLTNNSNVNDTFAETKLTENFPKMKRNQNCDPAPPPPPPMFMKAKQSETNRSRAEPIPHENVSPMPQSSLMSVSTFGKLVVDRSDIALPTALEEVGRVFTSAIRWGYFMEGVDTIAMYTQIRPIIQHGPQCGLVALSMASQICGVSSSSSRCQSTVPPTTPTTPSTPGSGTTASGMSAADLLESARVQGFSTHGEMFNADYLANLANMKLGDSVEASVRRDVLNNKHVFLELIVAGTLILVPYDAQPNHQPGLYNGHKAHWGVVSGALVQSRKFNSGVSAAAAFARPDARFDNLWHVRRGYHSSSRSSSRPSSRVSIRADDAQRLPEDEEKISTKSRRERSSSPPWRRVEPERTSRSMTPGGFCRGSGGASNEAALSAFLNVAPNDMAVVALWRQGKSRALISSTLEELCASNAQLSEYPQAQTDTGFEKDFIIGDVRRGLAGQVVVLNKTTVPLTALSDLLDRLQK